MVEDAGLTFREKISHSYVRTNADCIITYIPTKPERFDGYTIDHLFPRSLGFTLSGNAVLACRKCNERKGDRPPTPEEIVKAWSLYNQVNIQFTAKIIFP